MACWAMSAFFMSFSFSIFLVPLAMDLQNEVAMFKMPKNARVKET